MKKKALGGILALLTGTAAGIWAVWQLMGKHLKKYTSDPVRIDKEGKLYYMDYYGNYESFLIRFPVDMLKPVRNAACSCFSVSTPDGSPLTGRNFDLPHFDDKKRLTGLNVVIRCAPASGYKSVAVADAADISFIGVPYYKGSLDNPKTDKRYLALLPYICMDGVNEKGLSVSVLALDTKSGEHPVYQENKGKESVIISVLLRKILDNCASVAEAVSFAGRFNLVNTFKHDFQLFVTDDAGSACVIDWRNDVMEATYTDIATNFYVSADDAEDSYMKGELKEKFVPPADCMGYRFGYGHGYERFKTIMEMTGKCRQNGRAIMGSGEAMDVLQVVSQDYTGELTSMTQYSVVYDNRERSMAICMYPDYEHKYAFKL